MSNTRHSVSRHLKHLLYKQYEVFQRTSRFSDLYSNKKKRTVQYMMLTFQEKYMVEREKFRDPKTKLFIIGI